MTNATIKDELYRTPRRFAPRRKLGYKHQFRFAFLTLCMDNGASSPVVRPCSANKH